MVAKNEANQNKLEKTLEKVIWAEIEATSVIERLKMQKDLSIEVKVLNYFHEIINANPEPMIADYIPEKGIKIFNTTFLLISNSII